MGLEPAVPEDVVAPLDGHIVPDARLEVGVPVRFFIAGVQRRGLADAEHIKQFVDIPVIVAGRMQADAAEASLKAGKIDAVAIGRQFICDGEYLTKLKEGREADIRPCISCHNACLPVSYYTNSGAAMDLKDAMTQGHCALNPVSFAEKKYVMKKVRRGKTFAVIGGGVAGMQVAILLAEKGHKVDLYEKSGDLGGVFIAAAAPSFKEKDKELLAWYRRQLEQSSVTVHLNTEVRSLEELKADEVILATGASPRKLPLPGFEKGIDAVDYLNGTADVGQNVVIIGGGLTGCEIAYDLALKGKSPAIVEMTDDLVKLIGVCAANSEMLRDLMRYHKVPTYLESSLKEVREGSVVISTKDGEKELPCDSVILSVGYVPDQSLFREDKHVHLLGDAEKVGNLKTAIWSAYDMAMKF